MGFGGETGVQFPLGAVEKEPCGVLWPGSDSSSPALVFGEEEREAELLG